MTFVSVVHTEDEVHGLRTLHDLHDFTTGIFGRGKTLLGVLLFKFCLVFCGTLALCRYTVAPSALYRKTTLYVQTTLMRVEGPMPTPPAIEYPRKKKNKAAQRRRIDEWLGREKPREQARRCSSF